MSFRIIIENGTVTVEDVGRGKHVRAGVGKSKIAFLDDFTALDLETTGFSPEFCEIIEVGCVRYRGGSAVDSFSSLVKPHDMGAVDSYITQLTGITPEMLEDAPGIDTVLPDVLSFIGTDTVVGHNVRFDINFVYDNAERLGLPFFGNDYVDTMRLSRRVFPDFPNHKLKTLVKKFGIADTTDHRAASDAEQTALCYRHISNYVISNNLLDVFKLQSGFHGAVYARDIVGDSSKFDENNPLFGKIVVFTGTLERMTRRDAMQVVADLGGINGDTVTKKTNYLVLGNNDMCASIKDGKSTKQKKAEKYILDGADLAIISEDVFYDMLSEGPEILDPSTGSLPCAASQAEIYDIPHDGVELSGLETDFVRRIARILHDNPNYRNLTIERRTDNYVSIVIGYNDFLRFKCSPRAKWISLDLPQHIAAANIDNPIFAAQKNKGQRHWKASISSLDELDGLSDFINASCI